MSDAGSSRAKFGLSQLLVKASYDRANGLTRRIQFRDVEQVSFDGLKARVAECFSLSSNFSIAYKDDDGDEVAIDNDNDLIDALDFFQSGEQDGQSTKCVMKVFIVIGYEGPSLSETATFLTDNTRHSSLRRPPITDQQSASSPLRHRHHNGYDASIGDTESEGNSTWGRRRGTNGYGREQDTSASFWHGLPGPSRGKPMPGEHRKASVLREGVLDSTSDGHLEFERRWLADNVRGGQSADSTASKFSFRSRDDDESQAGALSQFRSTELDRLNAIVVTAVEPELLCCSSCGRKLADLRFVCVECGPLEGNDSAEVATQDEEESRASDSSSTAGNSRRGFELCEDCVDLAGAAHLQNQPDPRKHSFLEAHKMLDSRGWRVVEYHDSPFCSSCGAGPLTAEAHRCLSCASCDLCSACHSFVGTKHPLHPFQVLPPSTWSSPTASTISKGRRSRVRRQYSNSGSIGSRSSGNESSQTSVHAGCFCRSCREEIVGPRYHCTTCIDFDLCSTCESEDLDLVDMGSQHEISHIMLKLKLPVAPSVVSSFNKKDDSSMPGSEDGSYGQWDGHTWRRRSSSGAESWRPGSQGGPPAPWDIGPPPPPGHMWPWGHRYGPHRGMPGHPGPPPGPPPGPGPWDHFWRGPGPRHHGYGPKHGPPPIYVINTGGGSGASGASIQRLDSLDSLSLPDAGKMNLPHGIPCGACGQPIFGVRWMCANCPTSPTMDLCERCESGTAAHAHNSMHAWLRLSLPLMKTLEPRKYLLPIIYEAKQAGSDKSTVVGSENEMEAMQLEVSVAKHTNVLCDDCLQPISRIWMKCATCPTSPDLCEACFAKGSSKHDPNHIYIKLSQPVNMQLFKELTGLGNSGHLRPLIVL